MKGMLRFVVTAFKRSFIVVELNRNMIEEKTENNDKLISKNTKFCENLHKKMYESRINIVLSVLFEFSTKFIKCSPKIFTKKH